MLVFRRSFITLLVSLLSEESKTINDKKVNSDSTAPRDFEFPATPSCETSKGLYARAITHTSVAMVLYKLLVFRVLRVYKFIPINSASHYKSSHSKSSSFEASTAAT